ncbi:MAG: leucyl aminopeptidase [Blastocatellia bacterium]|nr:leucyl aminopeptidase [Blastocatellia bacterium]
MEFRVVKNYFEVTSDVLAVPVFEKESTEEGILKELNEATNGTIASLVENREFQGKANETAYIHTASGLKVRRLLLVGLGKKEKFSHNSLREFSATAVRTIKGKQLSSLAFLTRGDVATGLATQATVEGVYLAVFEPGIYKSRDKESGSLKEYLIVASDLAAAEEGLTRGKALGESTNFARELINEPSSNMTPKDMASRAEKVASEVGLEVKILGEESMKALGMGAILGVSQGSAEEAKLIVLKYEHPDFKGEETLALVGKGITFDSGGLSLKTAEGMEKMKYDMAGAAAVMGAMRAVALLKPKARVYGVMACAENMPSGTAIKPGDVLKTMSGRTIEVVNTDAEGRLVLADALVYAKKELGATHLVDVATLTGAVMIAFGSVYAGLMSTDKQMVAELISAGKEAGERLWQLPLDDEYGEQLKSDIADCKNSGGRPAGTITGGYFLKEFAGDTPWAHIDIASTGWNSDKKPYIAKGPTGMAVRTLANWVVTRSR